MTIFKLSVLKLSLIIIMLCFKQKVESVWDISNPIKFYKEGGDAFGTSIDFSNDNQYLAVGDPEANNNDGAVLVYKKNDNGNWDPDSIPTKLLPIKDPIGHPYFGWDLTFSVDSTNLAVLGPSDNDSIGAIWIFKKDNLGNWNTAPTKLVPNNDKKTNLSGILFAQDDNYLAVRNAYSEKYPAVWIFKKHLENWDPMPTKLTSPAGHIEESTFGNDIVFSSDNKYLFIGDYGDESVWIYKENFENWVNSTRLIPDVNIEQGRFGIALDFTSDNKYLAIGRPLEGKGTVWIYKNENDSWIYQTKLKSAQESCFGNSLIFSQNSQYLAVFTCGTGASTKVWIYKKDGFENWETSPNIIEAEGTDYFTNLFGFSSDNNYLAIGTKRHGADDSFVCLGEKDNENWGNIIKLNPDPENGIKASVMIFSNDTKYLAMNDEPGFIWIYKNVNVSSTTPQIGTTTNPQDKPKEVSWEGILGIVIGAATFVASLPVTIIAVRKYRAKKSDTNYKLLIEKAETLK